MDTSSSTIKTVMEKIGDQGMFFKAGLSGMNFYASAILSATARLASLC
jgi:hypothetical protein